MTRIVKRIFDLVFGILLGIAVVPLLVIVSVFIFVCSPE